MTDRIHDVYDELVDRAGAAGVVPSTGRTPREHAADLHEAGVAADDERDTLVSIVEASLYGEGVEPDREQAGVSLCRSLYDRLPEPPPPERARKKRRRPWFLRRENLKKIAAVVGGLALIVGASFFLRECSSNAPDPQDNSPVDIIGEASAASEAGSWATPRSKPSFARLQIPSQFPPRRYDEPGFDLTTGQDGFCVRDEIFTPPLGNHFRLYVYDAVLGDGTFVRPAQGARDGAAKRGPVTHRAKIDIRVRRGHASPIPSPAPGARVLSYTVRPNVHVRFGLDDCDQLYVVADHYGELRLTYELTSEGGYFSEPLAKTPFEPRPQPLPPPLAEQAAYVIDTIGELPLPTFDSTVRRLHGYFSTFAVAPLEPSDMLSSNYLTISLARKGVCRHRARAFVITAQALGIPCRLVENRAHAFAEVQQPDGSWRAIELRRGDEASTLHDLEAASLTASGLSSAISARARFVPLLWIILAVMIAVLAVLFQARRHNLDATAHALGVRDGQRGDRQAHASSTRRRTAAALHELLTDIRRSVECSTRAAPQRLHKHLAIVRDVDPSRAALETMDAREVTRVYWSCLAVHRWLDTEDSR